MADRVRGYLTVTVVEASGKTKEDEIVWEDHFQEGFVKVEVRGGPRNIKVQSTQKTVNKNAESLSWNETLQLEVLEGSKELRIVLCRDKRSGTQHRTSVVAACGIFVNDILDAVPIDKYFEMFKPGAAGEGGFIRVAMAFDEHKEEKHKPIEEVDEEPLAPTETGEGNETRPGIGESFKTQLSYSGYTADNSETHGVSQKENTPPLSTGSMTSPLPDLPQRHHKIADEAQSRDRTPELGSGTVYYDAGDVEEEAEEARPEPVSYTAPPEPPVQHNAPPEPVQHKAPEYDAPPQRVQEVLYEEHVQGNGRPQKKKKGNKFLKLFTGVLLIAAAGGAAYFAKQEMDKSQTSSPETLIVDDKIDSETISSE